MAILYLVQAISYLILHPQLFRSQPQIAVLYCIALAAFGWGGIKLSSQKRSSIIILLLALGLLVTAILARTSQVAMLFHSNFRQSERAILIVFAFILLLPRWTRHFRKAS